LTDARSQSDLPRAFEMLESVLVLITAAVLAPMLLGFALPLCGRPLARCKGFGEELLPM
jgi:hypothetical protein